MAYFPFMIQMEGRTCLIAGGGRVAVRKAEMMLSFGACVIMTAPEFHPDAVRLQQDWNSLTIVKRRLKETDLDGADVVIMATNDEAVNTRYAALCRKRRILVNVVDVKKDCSFYFPAVIRQDEVVIAVSTGGSSPALAAQIKQDIRGSIRQDYGKIAQDLGRQREKVLREVRGEAERKEILERMLQQRMQETKQQVRDREAAERDCGGRNRKLLRIGTRGSALARKQTQMVIEALEAVHPEYRFETVVMTTRGDRQTDRPIPSFGGKAVFVEEFEAALAEGSIDLAVHSAKDMPNPCRAGLEIAAALPRACVQDVLIYPEEKKTCIMAEKAFTIGTSSLRRRYQIQKCYPFAMCLDLRGNIGTRLRKLQEGQYDAIILAAAGLERQGLMQEPGLVYQYLSTEQVLPAAGQAVIAVEARTGSEASAIAADVTDSETQKMLMAERAVLTRLHAGCHEPVGVWAHSEDGSLVLELMTVQSGEIVRKKGQGTWEDWETLVEQICDGSEKR